MSWPIHFVISCLGGGLIGVSFVRFLYEEDYVLLTLIAGFALILLGWWMAGVFSWL